MAEDIYKIQPLKTQRKSPQPLWFRTFLRRYLNRFALLVAGAGFPGRPCSVKKICRWHIFSVSRRSYAPRKGQCVSPDVLTDRVIPSGRLAAFTVSVAALKPRRKAVRLRKLPIAFICPRQRQWAIPNELRSSVHNPNIIDAKFDSITKKDSPPAVDCLFLVAGAGFEPTTSGL